MHTYMYTLYIYTHTLRGIPNGVFSEHVVVQKPVFDISTGELTKLTGAGQNNSQNLYLFIKTCGLSSKSMF